MTLVKFAVSYAKEHAITLLPHQKNMLKSISEGKMFYHNPNASVIQDIIVAYKEYKKGAVE